MTVFLLLYASTLLQLSAAANLSKLPQRQEHRDPRASVSLLNDESAASGLKLIKSRKCCTVSGRNNQE